MILANVEYPLILVAKHGKRKYQSLGISIHPVNWDFLKNERKPNCPNVEYIQKIISDKINEVQKWIIEYTANGKDYTDDIIFDKTLAFHLNLLYIW